MFIHRFTIGFNSFWFIWSETTMKLKKEKCNEFLFFQMVDPL